MTESAVELVRQRLLVVDDEVHSGEVLAGALSLQGYEVALATDELEALRLVQTDRPDAVIVDLPAAGANVASLCRRLRGETERTPVLMLSQHDTVGHRVVDLEAGADDYLPKPVGVVELVARVKALLSRSAAARAETLRFADLVLDPSSRDVSRGARRIELTRTEFSLLELFLRNPRKALSRRVIFARVWGFNFLPDSNSLNVYVGHLRRKTEAEGEPRLIHTVRGIGYILRET